MLGETVLLPSGRPLVIRAIRPDDKPRLQEGLRRLSEETIHRRFLVAKPRFSSAELRYLTEVDGHDHIALVAADPVTQEIAAVARCVRFSDRPDTAEMAIVVGDELQGQGLGRELATRLAAAAKAAGVRWFAATMLGENVAARRLVQRISNSFAEDRAVGATREVLAELATATHAVVPAAA